MKTPCKAVQKSDQMVCPCGNLWDVNDIDPPKCKVYRPKEYYLAFGKYYDKPSFEEWEDYIHVIDYGSYLNLEQRLAAKEQDLRDYKHEWESACERVRDRDCEITDLKQRLADVESDLKKLVTAFKQTCNLTGIKQYEFLATLKTSLTDGSKDD